MTGFLDDYNSHFTNSLNRGPKKRFGRDKFGVGLLIPVPQKGDMSGPQLRPMQVKIILQTTEPGRRPKNKKSNKQDQNVFTISHESRLISQEIE